MIKKIFLSLIWIITLFPGQSQIINKEQLSERQTYYQINARLDTLNKIVEGSMETYWVNKSTDLVTDIQMHLYLNAFRNNRSTFYREFSEIRDNKESDYGWIDINSLTDRKGADLTPLMHYISPDDGNLDDMTVLKIGLHEASRPGDTVFLKIGFVSKLPERIYRTGGKDDFYFVGQWFPKFGVYESAGMRYASKGAWNCHQMHEESEFYSNHSVYDVTITVPLKYIVGTGGVLTKETISLSGEKTLTYRAEDIVDFAWTAWPGYSVYKDQWKHVQITLLLPDERKKQVARQMRAIKNALEYLAENVGSYPWPYLTIADPPSKGEGSGGMEYTTLFTSYSFTGVPDFFHFPEMATVHEFGHAYFMGILASNEFEEPWLDEGINQFWEERIMDHFYGENSGMIDHPLLKVSDKSLSRASYVYSDSRQVVSNNEYSWNYPHNTYEMMSYNKTATWLFTLMGLIGEETTNEVFREYYKKWAFKHPSGRDFVDIVNEVVRKEHGNKFGPDMNWFFDQTLYGTGICDYKVTNLYNRKISVPKTETSSGDYQNATTSAKDTFYKSVVELERVGEVMLPVDILIHFDNGEEVTESWDGKSRFKDFEYSGSRKVLWAKIDPEFKIRMDVNFINNSMTLEPDRVPVNRLINKLISLMQFFIGAITL